MVNLVVQVAPRCGAAPVEVLRQRARAARLGGDARGHWGHLLRAAVTDLRQSDSGGAALLDLGEHLAQVGWFDAAGRAFGAVKGRRRREGLRRRGSLAMSRGALPSAQRHFDSALRACPADPEARRALAEALRRQGRWAEAERHLESIARAFPTDRSAWRGLVDLAIERQDLPTASRILHALRRRHGLQLDDLTRLGRLQLAAGAWRQAEHTLRSAIDAGRDDPSLRAEAALAALGQGCVERAEAHLSSADPLHPRVAAAHARLALFCGQPAPAAELVARARRALRGDLGASARLASVAGDLAHALGDTKTAVDCWSQTNAVLESGRFHRDSRRTRAAQIRSVFSADLLDDAPSMRGRVPPMVFVVGEPGSGRGLVARILGAHPSCRHRIPQHGLRRIARELFRAAPEGFPRGAGSLGVREIGALRRRYLRPDRPDGQTWIDADPSLADTVGLGLLLFPHARVVLVDRAESDLAVSLLRRFDPRPSASHTRRPADARAWVQTHTEMMDHWGSVASIPPVRISYEALVSSPEHSIAELQRELRLPVVPADQLLGVVSPRRRGAPPLDTGSVGLGRRYASWLSG